MLKLLSCMFRKIGVAVLGNFARDCWGERGKFGIHDDDGRVPSLSCSAVSRAA